MTSQTEAWPELPYEAWKDTYATLHLWTQIAGKIRLAQTPWLNHSWHVVLYVTPRGLTTSAIGLVSSPAFAVGGSIVSPGVSRGTRSAVQRGRPAPALVLARTISTSATGALVTHALRPWTIRRSPCSSTRVRIAKRSDPTSGSLSAIAPTCSPAQSGRSQRAVQRELARCGREQIITAHHFSDLHRDVVHHHG